MFVGKERKAEVQRLFQCFARVREHSEPALVVYVAPPGWGKTRIVQELYQVLAAEQPQPAYWPLRLVGQATDGKTNVLQLGLERKAVGHRQMTVPAGASIPWLWLAPATGRLGDGSPAPVLDSLTRQLTLHLPHLLRRLERRKQLSRGLYKTLAAALPIPDLVELADAMLGIGEEIIDAWRSQRKAGSGERRVSDSDDMQRAQALTRMFTTLMHSGAPKDQLTTVLVLDDAHDLDPAAVAFVAELLSTALPILVIATTWPDRLSVPSPEPSTSYGSSASYESSTSPAPFSQFLAEAATGSRVTRVDLTDLTVDDLVDYMLEEFPRTDPQVAARLAERADRNPYALRLLLNLPRVADSVHDGQIMLAAADVMLIRGGLADLLGEHWARLSGGVQQILVVASLLGESFHDDVLAAGLARVPMAARLEDAFASAWIRPVGAESRIVEFVERLRYEIALERVPSVLTDQARVQVLAGALRSVHGRLAAEEQVGAVRRVLLALHVALARVGVETDLTRAARSAMELAEYARAEHRRQDAITYLTEASGWLEDNPTPSWSDLVRCLLDLSMLQSGGDTGETAGGEPTSQVAQDLAVRAMALADTHLPVADELRIRSRLTLARCRRRPSDPDAYTSCKQLISEAEQMMAQLLPSSSAEVVRQLRAVTAGVVGVDGDRPTAARLFEELTEFCEEQFGPYHRRTLDALEDSAFQAHRAGDVGRAVRARRTVLERRIELAGTAGTLQTVNARNNLAFSLLDSGSEAGLAEAEHLISEVLVIWSRTYGLDASGTQRARMLRTRLWCRLGLAAEAANDTQRAEDLFHQAAAEAQRLVELRRDTNPGTRAVTLQRYGAALACQRDLRAIQVLDEALSIRETELGQDARFWEVRTCARVLCWAYLRLGRHAEADSVRRRYAVDDSDPRPIV